MQDEELISIFLDSEMFKKLKEIADFKNESIEEIASMLIIKGVTEHFNTMSAFDDLVDN